MLLECDPNTIKLQSRYTNHRSYAHTLYFLITNSLFSGSLLDFYNEKFGKQLLMRSLALFISKSEINF